MRVTRMMHVVGIVMLMALAPASAGTQVQTPDADHAIAGSWLVTYDVPAFGPPFPLLVSLADGGVAIETDAPGAFPLGPGISVVLSNGHGAWSRARGDRAFTYLYRKLIFQQDGLTLFGMARTRATGTVQRDGTAFRAEISIELSDLNGQTFFETSGTATGTRISVEQE